MSIELKLVVWSVVLAFAQMLLAVAGAALQVGLFKLLGNREDMPKLPGWTGRAQRAHANMIENLMLFVPLVLVVQLAGRNNATTALGAEIFFFARLAYAFIYVFGIRYLRTLTWTISVIGLVMIFSQLV